MTANLRPFYQDSQAICDQSDKFFFCFEHDDMTLEETNKLEEQSP